MRERKCLICGEILHGRSDQKFCSDKCRNQRNNDKKRVSEKIFITCNKTLRQNRNLLFKLCPQGETVVTKDALEKLGYNFELFTSMYVSDKKEMKYICYDYCYFPFLDKQTSKVLIMKKELYMHFNPWRYAKPKDWYESSKHV